MTIGSHQQCVGKSQVHLTPKWIVDALGPFDLDPCAATTRPWDCATRNIVEAEDGLAQPWTGRVWLNPPFDRYQVSRWVERLVDHGRGTLLVHARTETAWFRPVWERASAILFLSERLKFHRPDGSQQEANSGAPVVLAAFGDHDAAKLARAGLKGWLVEHCREVLPTTEYEGMLG